MTIEQTITIAADRRITLDVPREVPAGQARVIIQFPVEDEAHCSAHAELAVPQESGLPEEARGQINNEAFRQVLRRAYGAWKDNPWTDHLEDINAMRNEWEHRDLWNPDPAKRHRD